MAYTIKVTYTSGDSYKTENGLCGYVGAIWNDIEEARIALKYIAEQYDAQKNSKQRIEKFSKEPWYDKEYPEYCLLVPIDGGY